MLAYFLKLQGFPPPIFKEIEKNYEFYMFWGKFLIFFNMNRKEYVGFVHGLSFYGNLSG